MQVHRLFFQLKFQERELNFETVRGLNSPRALYVPRITLWEIWAANSDAGSCVLDGNPAINVVRVISKSCASYKKVCIFLFVMLIGGAKEGGGGRR